MSISGNDFVKLTTNQTIAGTKTFSSDAVVNGITVGKGAGAEDSNTAVGVTALSKNTTGNNNTANGYQALYDNTIGNYNTANGYAALLFNIGGNGNSANGYNALYANTTGNDNTANGYQALFANTGSYNTANGYQALNANTTGSNNTAIGYGANVNANNLTNATAIGNGAIVASSNTIQLGNGAITNVKTSGTITAGAVTYPNAHGLANQVLQTNGNGTLSWATPSTTATNVSGVVAIANGGTGSATKNFVDLTTTQTVAGTKTFSSDVVVNGITVGKGAGAIQSNTAVGVTALYSNTTGVNNTANGYQALYDNTTGDYNTANGYAALLFNIGGNGNSANGYNALYANTTGSNNTANGYQALFANNTGSSNTANGYQALNANTTGSNNTAIGYGANVNSNNLTNATAIGNGAIVASSNTIQLGNTSVTNVKTSGTLTANGFVKSGGTATQFLMADGSVSTGAAAVREVADEFTATLNQTSFTLTHTPSANSMVKMYVNGIRISNAAYSWSDATLTYNPSNNGGYSITAGDRIQFDFYY